MFAALRLCSICNACRNHRSFGVQSLLADLLVIEVLKSTDFEIVFTVSGSLPHRSTQQDNSAGNSSKSRMLRLIRNILLLSSSVMVQDGSLAFWLSLDDCTKQFDEKAR